MRFFSCIISFVLLMIVWPAEAMTTQLKGRWIALVVEYSSADYTRAYIAGAKEQAAELGLRIEVHDAGGVKSAMGEMIDDVTLRNVDGIMVSHGDPELLLPSLRRAVRKQVPVVAIHNAIDLDGVSLIGQDDRQIARLIMQKMVEDSGGKGELALIWAPGFEPFRKRMEIYDRLMTEHTDLHEIIRFGTSGARTSLYTEMTMMHALAEYPVGSLDIVMALWDEYAKGVARAVMKSGRSKDVRLYGIDVSDSVIKMLQDPANPWVATVGVDARLLGKVQVRMLAHAVLGNDIPRSFSLSPVLITKEMLPPQVDISMENLDQYVPGWGKSSHFSLVKSSHSLSPKDN